jgi:hypothetical protein
VVALGNKKRQRFRQQGINARCSLFPFGRWAVAARTVGNIFPLSIHPTRFLHTDWTVSCLTMGFNGFSGVKLCILSMVAWRNSTPAEDQFALMTGR